MVIDNQIHVGVAINDESEVFTLNDRALLDSLADRYAPDGLDVLRGDRVRLLELIKSYGGDHSTAVAEWLETHKRVADDDWRRLQELRDKAHEARVASMEPERYQTLTDAVGMGLVGGDEANRTIRDEQRARRHEAFELANGMVLALSALEGIIGQAPEATANPTDQRAELQSFTEFDEWETAKERFRERYDAAPSIAAKGKLRERFPELAAAALDAR